MHTREKLFSVRITISAYQRTLHSIPVLVHTTKSPHARSLEPDTSATKQDIASEAFPVSTKSRLHHLLQTLQLLAGSKHLRQELLPEKRNGKMGVEMISLVGEPKVLDWTSVLVNSRETFELF